MAAGDKAKAALATKGERKPDPGRTIAHYMELQKPAIAAALPRNMDPDRFVRIVLTEARRNPKLLQCDAMSLLGAVMVAAQTGLEPGPMGLSYLVPYWNKHTNSYDVQFQIGYRGLVQLARNSGDVSAIFAFAVREGDDFKMQYGTDPSIHHEPLDAPVSGREITHVYASATLRGGDKQFAVMRREEVDAIRDRSQAGSKGSGPWTTDYEQMALKTVVRRLCKMLPLSMDVARAIAQDDVVKRELTAEMELVPDAADGEPLDAEAIGATLNEGERVNPESGEIEWDAKPTK